MTFVGKILVLINLVMSFMFMAFAVMVYTTRTDLKGELAEQKALVSKAGQEKSDLETKNADLEKKLQVEQANLKKAKDDATKTVADLNSQIQSLQSERQTIREENQKSLAQLQTATTEQQQRREEVKRLNDEKFQLLESNNKLISERTELSDNLAKRESELALLTERNQQLNERLTQLEGFVVRTRGKLPNKTELDEAAEGPPPPPDVEGIVQEVNESGKYIVISLGEDDGIRKDQELDVWRYKPEPKYVGKVRIFLTEATRAVAKPVVTEAMIVENDRVGPASILQR